MTCDLLVIAFALFLSGTVQSIGGFGAMLVAVPLVTLVLPLQTAVPLLATLGIPITLVVFYTNRHGIDWWEVARITAGSLLGIPLGLWALAHIAPPVIMRILGSLLVIYSLYALFIEPRLLAATPPVLRRSGTMLSFIVGVFSGALGGAFNTSGPPLILYGDWLRWPRERFKAMLQGVFFVNGSLIVAGHVIAGNINATMIPYAAIALPGILLGLWTGHRINRHINARQFRYTVLCLLAIMGTSLLLR